MNSITELIEKVRANSSPLKKPPDLDPLVKIVGDRVYVLLGEASHGTHEFYTWRAEISKRLIEEKGFSFVAVEGDWPDSYLINRYVKGYPNSGRSAYDVLHSFSRWPTWMWANWEMVEFIEWLRKHNDYQPKDRKVGFYGLDVYSLWESMEAIIHYLQKVDPKAVRMAVEAYLCFEPYHENAQEYMQAAAFVPTNCTQEVVNLLSGLRRKRTEYEKGDKEAYFNAEQNAFVAKNAEEYYRTVLFGDAASWNVRDRHMAQTLGRLTEFHGRRSKAIVWAHNTHIGDARATDMVDFGMINLGQLAREKHQDKGVVLVGFGSYKGTVIASTEWGAPLETMFVPHAREGSWEDVFYRSGEDDKVTIFPKTAKEGIVMEPRGLRAIGVVYDPYAEKGNYVPSVLANRFDTFLYINQTKELRPLHMRPQPDTDLPETYPTAV